MSIQERSGFSDKVLIFALIWAVGLVGALMLPFQLMPAGHSASVCGPWGCGPPTASLAAWHGFWFVLLLFPTSLLCRYVPRNPLRWIGGAVVILGVMSFATITWWETTRWLPAMGEFYQQYLQQRVLFVIALCGVPTETLLPPELILPVIPHLPISEIFLMGIGTLAFGFIFKKRTQPVFDAEDDATLSEQPMEKETEPVRI